MYNVLIDFTQHHLFMHALLIFLSTLALLIAMGVDLIFGVRKANTATDKAKKMLYEIEVYASACYDNTARHKANVSALDSADKVMAYDYTTGYPDKLSF